jgi:hypothetical protein
LAKNGIKAEPPAGFGVEERWYTDYGGRLIVRKASSQLSEPGFIGLKDFHDVV